MTQEALTLALEWAEANGEIVFAGGGMDAVNKMNSWATAIKEALREHAMREVQRLGQEIEQEPVAYWKEHAQGLQRDYDSLLADFQAQRTWVGLTDEDKKQMAKEANYHWEMTAGEYAERIGQLTEAKLKELNS